MVDLVIGHSRNHSVSRSHSVSNRIQYGNWLQHTQSLSDDLQWLSSRSIYGYPLTILWVNQLTMFSSCKFNVEGTLQQVNTCFC